MKTLNIIIALILIFSLNSCSRDRSPLAPQNQKYQTLPVTHLQKQVIQTNNQFSFALFSQTNKLFSDQNVFISPFSVSMVLGMALNGAKGETYAAIRNTLGFTNISEQSVNQTYGYLYDALQQLDSSVTLEIANSVWCKQGLTFLPQFLSLNKTYFDAEIRTLNFADPQAVLTINQWIASATHNKIKHVIRSIPPDAIMYLINALYFHGSWQYEFPPQSTRQRDFYLTDGTQISCDMMATKIKIPIFINNTIKAVQLPYGQGNFVVTVIMPKNASEFNDYVFRFDGNLWQHIDDSLRSRQCTIILPKLRFSFKTILNTPLKDLGMGIAFGSEADFSRISANSNLRISKIIHQTYVEINEKGTEAAAVTVGEIGATSIQPHNLTITFDHPYLFVISEKSSGTLLFMGKILRPVWTN